MRFKETGLYTAFIDGPRMIRIVDASTGKTENRITYQGEIQTGPVIIGDRMTFTTLQNGQRLGFIYRLPRGGIIKRFAV